MAPSRRIDASKRYQAKSLEDVLIDRERARDAALQLDQLRLFSSGLGRKADQIRPAENDCDLDISGFYPEEVPLEYIPAEQAGRTDGELYVVVHKRIALRKTPDQNARVLGAACAGERMLVFELDPSETWRKTHFRLYGGRGGLVAAWVMTKHPSLGTLVKPFSPSDSSVPSCICGVEIKPQARFCSTCGFQFPRLEPNQGAVEEAAASKPSGRAKFTGPPPNPNGLRPGHCDEHRQDLEDQSISLLTGVEVSRLDHLPDGLPGTQQGKECFIVLNDPTLGVRLEPSIRADICAVVSQGQQIDTFAADESGKWRMVYGKSSSDEVRAAWVPVELGNHILLQRLDS